MATLTPMPDPAESTTELTDPEDHKLVTLARSARSRTGATQGAAVRDTDGRTYAAASVALQTLTLSALQVTVAMAVSSGSRGLEAAVVLGGDALDPHDVACVREMAGAPVPVHLVSAQGAVLVSDAG